MSKRTYLDYASVTPIDRKVLREMDKYSDIKYANPSSWYKEGVLAKNALSEMRKKVSNLIHAHLDEIVFTGGGTESNNLAILGTIRKAREDGIAYDNMHVIVSPIEHSSVMECLLPLRKKGVSIDILKVDRNGMVDPNEVRKVMKRETVLVSVMHVNNEIGTIMPIHEISKAVRKQKLENGGKYPLFHTDAAQAFCYEDIDMEKVGVDLMTLDGSKIYGPRGVGCLYVRRNTPIASIIYGGGQEGNLRSGTESLPQIAGFALSLEMAHKIRNKEIKRLSILKKRFLKGLHGIVPDLKVNGDGERISPHICNISIPGIDNEFMLFQLDAKGIACSTKSSCLTDEDESYVIKAIGGESKWSLRFSFGRYTENKDIDFTVLTLKSLLGK